jgi:RNA polymerase sigma-70 factor (ECF subfamily)
MAISQDNGVIRNLRRIALLHDPAGMTDGMLLERFLSMGEQAAFELLVRRHGPMVLGVCHRILNNSHDAEDAFQAVFLVLIRKGPSLLPRPTFGNWLYGVAYHTALKARAASWKRRTKERQAAAMSKTAVPPEDLGHDVLPLLDEELNRLPEKYREAVVLCELEGKTREQAARHLGVPVGTLSGRLTTARRMLSQRFARRGVALSGVALAGVLTPRVTSAAVPSELLAITVKSAAEMATGAGALSAEVAALTHGMMKSMFVAKLKVVTAVLLIVAGLTGGVSAFRAAAAGQANAPPNVEELKWRPKAQESAARTQTPKSAPETAAVADDQARLQGEWVPISAVVGGRETDPSNDKILRSALSFKANAVILWQAKGVYSLEPNQNPKHLDIELTVKDRSETILAIYEFDHDRLIVSWINGGERAPNFDTGRREGVFIVYRKK